MADDKHKCCLGLTYYNRSIEQRGKPPICLGLRQSKEGNIDYTDSRHLAPETRDFKYYCLGYAIHPEDQQSTKAGSAEVLMPYCEGVEVAITEEPDPLYQQPEQTPLDGMSVVASDSQQSPAGMPYPQHAQQAQINPSSSSSSSSSSGSSGSASSPPLAHGGTPGSGSSSGDDRNRQLHARFKEHLNRNANALWSVLSGNIPTEKLPVRLREFGSATELVDRLGEVAGSNVRKVAGAASAASTLAYDRLKEVVLERLRGTEPEN